MSQTPTRSLELRSRITAAGVLELWLEAVAVPTPAADELLIRVEATPINPSDLGLLLGPVDPSSLRSGGTPAQPTLTGVVPAARLPELAGRLDAAMPVGNEGAGTVVAAGAAHAALVGRVVAARGLGMYAQYRVVKAADCVVLPAGATARQGASAFINPLTALGMLETLRREGHRALVHTAAASNLGRMLVRLCQADGVPLVNVVRSGAQAELLRGLGARWVVDTSAPDFRARLEAALDETGATIAFDAVGGGTLAGTILGAMERVAVRKMTSYSRYGSPTHKQIYIYGMLDPSPRVLDGNFGLAWSVGGWLLTYFLQRIAPADALRLRDRVAAELTTTFASDYSREISLTEALAPEVVAAYAKRATGEKFLIVPNR